jgi:hypothetical protein
MSQIQRMETIPPRHRIPRIKSSTMRNWNARIDGKRRRHGFWKRDHANGGTGGIRRDAGNAQNPWTATGASTAGNMCASGRGACAGNAGKKDFVISVSRNRIPRNPKRRTTRQRRDSSKRSRIRNGNEKRIPIPISDLGMRNVYAWKQ